jgi:cytosine deaminase
MANRLALRACRLADGRVVDLVVDSGAIAAIDAPGALPAMEHELDAAGRLVTPGLADPHLHPDKAFGLDEATGSGHSLTEAIAAVRAQKPSITAAAVRERTLRLLRWCLDCGTTRVRVHAEVDPLLELRSVEGVLAARSELRDKMLVQVVAFPQEGIVREPGTLDLMREAIAMGCDVVGAISYQDPDPVEHLSLTAELAAELHVPLDVHADFGVPASESALGPLVDVVHRFGLERRVAAGHCTTLARMDPPIRAAIAGQLQRAGVTVISLPRTDLFMDGVVAPLEHLRSLGICCHVGTNNVRNAFTPVGRPSLPSVAAVYALAAHAGDKAALDDLARSLWRNDLFDSPGDIALGAATAGLCIWPVDEPWRLVTDEPEPDIVIAAGVPVAGRQHRQRTG